jgi:WD40 repeat protein
MRGAEPNVLEGHTNSVKLVAFSRDRVRIVSGSYDVGCVDGCGAECAQGPHQLGPFGCIFERWYADCVWLILPEGDASTFAELNVLNDHTDSVKSVAFSRDSMRIVSGSDDMAVTVWDVLTGTEMNPAGSVRLRFLGCLARVTRV